MYVKSISLTLVAVAGAVIGGLVGKAESNETLRDEQRHVLIRCMQGRGYKVVG